MTRFNSNIVSKPQIPTTNLAGGEAFKQSAKAELAFAVLTSFLDDKFYESSSARLERIQNLIREISDHQFLAKLAIITRKEFHMRSTFHVLAAELAKVHRGDNLVFKVIVNGVERPDDLTEIVAYLGKPIPNQVKKACAKVLQGLSEYSLGKYKQSRKEVSLVDLFNLTSPKPTSPEQDAMWKKFIKGELKSPDTWEVAISASELHEDKVEEWTRLVLENKLGYMALLRNLNNIDKYASSEAIKIACEKIDNKEEVKKSMQFPFSFYTAYKHVENQDMLEAISKGLEYSLENVPTFEGKTLIAVDASCSMRNTERAIDIAALFAGALFKANNAELIMYDTSVQKVKLLKATPILEMSKIMESLVNGGATRTSLVFEYALQEKFDRIVIISDNESWSEHNVQNVYDRYRKFNDSFVYAIDIAGYGTIDIKSSKKVFHLAGWSEKIFDFMSVAEKGKNFVQWIDSYSID